MFAELDGEPVAVEGGAGWSQTHGVAPHVRGLVFTREQAGRLIQRARPEGSSLRLRDDQGNDRLVRRLTILRSLAADNPHLIRLLVGDRRWAWLYPSEARAYNVRVRGAAVRRRGGGPLAVAPTSPAVGFEQWSLRQGEPWEPDEVLRDVLDVVAGEGDWSDREDNVLGKELAPVEDLRASGRHSAFLATVLNYFGEGITLRVEDSGEVMLLDRASSRERELVIPGSGTSGERPRVQPGPGWVFSERAIERPERVRVLFEPLPEIRLDRKEDESEESSQTRTQDQSAPPRVDDVVYLPVDKTVNGVDLAPASLVTLDDFLGAIAGDEPSGLDELTRDLIRKLKLSEGLNQYVLLDRGTGNTPQTGLWQLYIPAIDSAWRRRWQPRKAWRDRIRRLYPVLSSVLDPQTGTLGAAAVYGDYAIKHTWRNPDGKRESDLREVHEQMRNSFASANGPGNIVDTKIEDLRKAPARVTIRDQDQKVIEVDYQLSTEGDVAQVYRCAIDPDRMPTHRIGRRDEFVSQASAWFQESFEQSILLSAVMGSPNSKDRLWAVEVEPNDVSEQIRHRITPAKGPVLEVIVPGSRVPARFEWSDERKQQIYDAFSEDSPATLEDAYPNGPVNQEQLEELAKAIAASVYLQLADRVTGGLRTNAQDLQLLGTAERVSWEWDPRAGAVTDIVIPEDGLSLDPEAFLPTSVRRALDFLVDPEAGT